MLPLCALAARLLRAARAASSGEASGLASCACGCAPAGAKGVAKIAAIMGVEAKANAPKVARVLCNGELGIAKHKFDYVGVRSCRVAASIAGGPKLCPYACVGLGDCELACKFGAISIVNDLARVDAHKCVACGACEKACPRSVIKLLPAESTVTVRCQNSETGRIARETLDREMSAISGGIRLPGVF